MAIERKFVNDGYVKASMDEYFAEQLNRAGYGGMGAKPTAEKIFNSGMQIPGFRRNISSIEKVTQRYIPKVTVIGGAFIGALTLVASLLGTLGSAGGTGLLLTVSIVYRLYEDIASEQMMEMHPMIRSFFGEQ